MISCEDMGEILAPYALGALDILDRKPVEAHIQACLPCAQLAREYQEIASSLPYGVPLLDPPADLKEKVMGQIAMQPQTPLPTTPAPSRWQRFWSSLDALLRPRAVGIALVGAVAVLALTIWVIALETDLNSERTASQTLAENLRQQQQTWAWALLPAVRKYALGGTDAAPRAWGTMLFEGTSQQGMLVVADMAPLSGDKVYQLWLVQDNQRTSGGTFAVDTSGRAQLRVWAPQPLTAYQSMGVTIEPVGGSPGPTGPRVLRGPMQPWTGPN